MNHHPHSAFGISQSNATSASIRRGFTLTEVLVTVGVLIILMGLAVSLAREVRRRSADLETRELLAHLDHVMAAYFDQHARLPDGVPPLIEDAAVPPDDLAVLARSARRNNQAIVAVLQRSGLGFGADEQIARLPRSMYDTQSLRDAWGSPIVFMPQMHQAIGMADDDRPYFFVSAGPDANYLTREDNLYSYEGR